MAQAHFPAVTHFLALCLQLCLTHADAFNLCGETRLGQQLLGLAVHVDVKWRELRLLVRAYVCASAFFAHSWFSSSRMYSLRLEVSRLMALHDVTFGVESCCSMPELSHSLAAEELCSVIVEAQNAPWGL